MVSISRIFETDIEMSYPVKTFLDTEHNFLPTIINRCTKVHQVWCTKRVKETVVISR